MSKKRKKSALKKMVPNPWTIPAIAIIGAVGATVAMAAIPGVMQAIANATPTLKLPGKKPEGTE